MGEQTDIFQATYPKVNFVSRDTGSRISMDIGDVLATYDNDRKEASKERARAKERKPKGYRQMYD